MKKEDLEKWKQTKAEVKDNMEEHIMTGKHLSVSTGEAIQTYFYERNCSCDDGCSFI